MTAGNGRLISGAKGLIMIMSRNYAMQTTPTILSSNTRSVCPHGVFLDRYDSSRAGFCT
jgi:hypothetical protein